MDDLTVKVVGVNSGGSGSVPPQTPSNPPSQPTTPGTQLQARDYMPDASRLTEEYRRLLQQQGGVVIPGSSNSRQLWSQVEANARQGVSDSVAEKYNERRLSIAEKYDKKRETATFWRDDERADILEKSKRYGWTDAGTKKRLDEVDKEYESAIKEFNAEQSKETRQANKEEKDELASALRELTAVLKDSKEAVERDDERGDNPDSYLGRLRAERRQILEERENAATEEEAVSASKRLAEVDDRIKRASTPSDTDYLRTTQLVAGGVQQTFGGLQEVNPAGIISGIGSTAVGLSGATGASAMKALGWVGLVAGLGKGVWDAAQGSAERYNAMGNLAAMRNTFYGLRGEQASAGVRSLIENGEYMGLKVSDFGMSYTDFASRAAQMNRARGTSDDWFNETMRQIGLEKELALESGTLTKGSQYDRYGINVTDALSRMVMLLEKVEGSGVSASDFTRVQEKYDIQQQIMGSYMNRSDKPDYDVANKQLLAMSSVRGITQDARIGSDFQQFQNAIQNPMNDRMKALLYSTVQEMMPEMVGTNGEKYTALDAGRMDLIDRAIRNPQNEGKIIQAMIQKISEMYGGIDTQMGYFAFKNLFPNISPDRLDAYVKQISDPNSYASIAFKETLGSSEEERQAKQQFEMRAKAQSEVWTGTSPSYVADLTKDVAGIRNNIGAIIDKLDDWLNGRGWNGGSRNGQSGN